MDVTARRVGQQGALHRDLWASKAEPGGQIGDPAPWGATGRKDHVDAGPGDGSDRAADDRMEPAAAVEDGAVDVTGQEPRPDQASADMGDEGCDDPTPFGTRPWRARLGLGAMRSRPGPRRQVRVRL
jgi:hypothetical protein